jgi:hypothetical protein
MVPEKTVRYPHQNARSVSGGQIPPDGPPVHEIPQYGYALLYDLMILGSIYVGQKANSTAIVFEHGIIESEAGVKTSNNLLLPAFHRNPLKQVNLVTVGILPEAGYVIDPVQLRAFSQRV